MVGKRPSWTAEDVDRFLEEDVGFGVPAWQRSLLIKFGKRDTRSSADIRKALLARSHDDRRLTMWLAIRLAQRHGMKVTKASYQRGDGDWAPFNHT